MSQCKTATIPGSDGLVGAVGRTHAGREGCRSVMDFKVAEECRCKMWEYRGSKQGQKKVMGAGRKNLLVCLVLFGFF